MAEAVRIRPKDKKKIKKVSEVCSSKFEETLKCETDSPIEKNVPIVNNESCKYENVEKEKKNNHDELNAKSSVKVNSSLEKISNTDKVNNDSPLEDKINGTLECAAEPTVKPSAPVVTAVENPNTLNQKTTYPELSQEKSMLVQQPATSAPESSTTKTYSLYPALPQEESIVVQEASAPPAIYDDIRIQNVNEDILGICTVAEKPKAIPYCGEDLLIPSVEGVKAYSENELKMIYCNSILEKQPQVVAKFIENEKKTTRHVFYEHLQDYYRSRKKLKSCDEKIKVMDKSVLSGIEECWEFETDYVTEEDVCEDNAMVEVTHEFQTASYRVDIAELAKKEMIELRSEIYETYTLHSYTSERTKILVENYLCEVMNKCRDFQVLPLNSPVVCMESHPEDLDQHITDLRDCCSVLFAFLRKNLQDDIFKDEIRMWLTDLIAILLRFATISDHHFILNQVLRCPKGLASWASSFIQVVPPYCLDASNDRGDYLLDHCVAVLAAILSKPTARDTFLESTKPSFLKQDDGDIWVLMSEDGAEEEQNQYDLWCNLEEDDIIKLVNQIPFESLFRHILGLPMNSDVADNYNITEVTSTQLFRLFSFCSQLINILETGLTSYSSSGYKDLNKRLCRLILHVVSFINCQWSNYLLLHLNNPAFLSLENNAYFKNKVCRYQFPSNNSSWSKLQVEYDSVCYKAFHIIASNVKFWQCLAVFCFEALSMDMLWAITYELHTGETPPYNENWAELLGSSDISSRFSDRLLTVSPGDSYYLLTAFANMANSRAAWHKEFIEVAVSNIFQICVLCNKAREFCSRSGRDLLHTIATKHPNITMSTLLNSTQNNLEDIEDYCLYLYNQLPLELWRPSDEELHLVLHWLSYCPAASQENAIARVILSKLNWGFEGVNLALPPSLHLKVALGIASACNQAEEKIGVSVTSPKNGFLVDGMKSVTSAVCSETAEQKLINWCWQQISLLKLHKLDQLATLNIDQIESLLNEVPNINHPSLNSLYNDVIQERPISLYVALLASSFGSSWCQIFDEGLPYLSILLSHHQYSAIVTSLSCLTPLLWKNHEKLVKEQSFTKVLQNLLEADQTYYHIAKSYIVRGEADRILSLFYSMIHSQIISYAKYGLDNPRPIFKFWVSVFTSLPNWERNQSVLILLNNIARLATVDFPQCFGTMGIILERNATSDQYLTHAVNIDVTSGPSRVMASLWKPLSGISSVVQSWYYNTQGHSFLPQENALHPYLSYMVLRLDSEWEDSNGLWKEILSVLHYKQQETPDSALEVACKTLKISNPLLNNLTVYRWGQHLLYLPVDNPAFLLTLQAFMTRHLCRVPGRENDLMRGSVIHRFYEGFLYINYLNKIKNKVQEALDYYKNWEILEINKAMDSEVLDSESKSDEMARLPLLKGYTEKTQILTSILSWLNEDRLYKPTYSIPSMPQISNIEKLNYLVEGCWIPWEIMFCGYVEQNWCSEVMQKWKEHRTLHKLMKTSSRPSSHSSSRPSSPQEEPVSDSGLVLPNRYKNNVKDIARRLKGYDCPVLPPQLPKTISSFSPPNSPTVGVVKRTGEQTNIDLKVMDAELRKYFDNLLIYGESMVNKWRETSSSDCNIMIYLPQLYTNVQTRLVVRQQCQPPPPPQGRPPLACSGAANIILEFSEKKKCEATNVRLEFLLSQRKEIYNESCKKPPLQICSSAAAIDTLSTLLVNEFRRAYQANPSSTLSNDLWKCGWNLFWHVVKLASTENFYYPPVKQIIASCSELLGNEFLAVNASCQEEIMVQVFNLHEVQGNLVAPHFCPTAGSDSHFISLYSSLSTYSSCNQDLLFMLLSKFDIHNFTFSASDASSILEIIGKGMHILLDQRGKDVSLSFGIYRLHWFHLLKEFYNELYPQSVQQLITLTSNVTEENADLVSTIWYDVINISLTHRDSKERSREREIGPESLGAEIINDIRLELQSEVFLNLPLVHQTIDIVSSVLSGQRLSQAQYGLIPIYKHCMAPLSAWCALTYHALVVFTPVTTPQHFLALWAQFSKVWDYFICPLSSEGGENSPDWVKHLVDNDLYLQPWPAVESDRAGIIVASYASSLSYLHLQWRNRVNVLSAVMQKYCKFFALQKIKSHVLSVVHTHLLSAIVWLHFQPSYQDLRVMNRVINEYLTDCHSFLCQVIVKLNWTKIVSENISSFKVISPTSPVDGENDSVLYPRTTSPAKLHHLMLNIFVRISMEPTVRQTQELHSLLNNAQNFHWEYLDSKNFEQILDWYIMSCDCRVLLDLPSRSPIDKSILDLFHVAADFTPQTGVVHPQTDAKRQVLLRFFIRLLTTSAVRHMSLLTTQYPLFKESFMRILSHLQSTVNATVAPEDEQQVAEPLCAEVIAVISHGASTSQLQEVFRNVLVEWLENNKDLTLLRPLLSACARHILILNQRCIIMEALITSIFRCDKSTRWSTVVDLLYFPATSPTPLMELASKDGNLLILYAYMVWNRRNCPRDIEDTAVIVKTLNDSLKGTPPSEISERGFLLLLGEILDVSSELVLEKKYMAAWDVCNSLCETLCYWQEERKSDGILGVIGFGSRSTVSIEMRVLCRSIRAFLLSQLLTPGIFCSINEHPTDKRVSENDSSLSALTALIGLRSNSLFAGVVSSVDLAIQYIQDPNKIFNDVVPLYSMLVQQLFRQDLMIRHMEEATEEGRLQWNVNIPTPQKDYFSNGRRSSHPLILPPATAPDLQEPSAPDHHQSPSAPDHHQSPSAPDHHQSPSTATPSAPLLPSAPNFTS